MDVDEMSCLRVQAGATKMSANKMLMMYTN